MEAIQTLFTILLGGGILTFVQFLINRYDSKNDKDKAILNEIKTLGERVERIEESLDERDAILARLHILSFKDELYNGVEHSMEYFEQMLDDAALYGRYCETHPDFANGRTKAATEYIRSEYDRLFKEHKL